MATASEKCVNYKIFIFLLGMKNLPFALVIFFNGLFFNMF